MKLLPSAAALASVLVLAAPAYSATVVAQYGLAGNSNDSSGNGYNGVDTDMSYVVDGVRGTVASFNGSTSSIDLYNGGTGVNYSLGDQGTNSVNSTVTVSMWIKPTAQLGGNSNPDALILLGGSGPGKGVIEIVGDTSWSGMGGGSAYGGVGINSGGGGGSTGKVGTIDLYDGNWHHVVLQWAGDPATQAEVWIDNTAATSTFGSYNGSANDPNAVRLGGPAVWSNGGAADKYYVGLMSDVRLFDGLLTAQDVDTLYNIPEPASSVLLGLAGGLLMIRRRR